MKFRWFGRLSVLVSLFLVGIPVHSQPQPGTRDFLPFDEFFLELANSDWSTYRERSQTKTKAPEDFEAMQRHLLSLYEGVHVTHSLSLGGQVFDCVPFDEQPAVRAGLAPEAQFTLPPLPVDPGSEDRPFPSMRSMAGASTAGATQVRVGSQAPPGSFSKATQALERQGGCASGYIPMRRVTLEEVSRFSTLREFLDKGPKGAGRVLSHRTQGTKAVNGHNYAVAQASVTNTGGYSWINLWSPPVSSSWFYGQMFSLSQQWFAVFSPTTQTVEGGWQVYPRHYNTGNAVLFIYWTADNYQSTGCYNLECAGFVQTNPNWYLGAGWSAYSTQGGTQYGFGMQWQLSNGNWWLYLEGQAVGYYPTSIYQGGTLAQRAEEFDLGGETYGSIRWPAMGSGAFASSGQAAYHRSISYFDLSGFVQYPTFSTSAPRPACYTALLTAPSAGGYFFFGGPGGTSACQ
jgi:hypothetical protein